MATFTSVLAALQAGFHVNAGDARPYGYRARQRTAAGWIYADVVIARAA